MPPTGVHAMLCARMSRPKNTLEKANIRYLIFREGDTWYGAALELNIVEDATDPREAFVLLMEAVYGYIEGARRIKGGEDVLNQEPDPEYEALWQRPFSARKRIDVFATGILNIPSRRKPIPMPA